MGTTDRPDVPFTYQALVMRDPDASTADEAFNAFALELDLCGVGATAEAALEELAGNVEAQVEHAVDQGDLGLLDFPAPEEYQSIARELRAAYLRGEVASADRFVRSMPLPTGDGAAHRAA